MQTRFTAEQLRDRDLQVADAILRRCVHCGFCLPACPTYQATGNELDGPRGRIYLIKGLLESGPGPGGEEVRRLDGCLSCLACASACPSGVDYMHLVDLARPRIARHAGRAAADELLRHCLAWVLPRSAGLGRTLGWLRHLLSRVPLPRFLAPAAALLGAASPGSSPPLGAHYPATGESRGAVALLAGCVQQALGQEINHATVRVLNRCGFDVDVIAEACCGAIPHHLGAGAATLSRVRRNVAAWSRHRSRWRAILVNSSGCGTMLKDYVHLLSGDPHLHGPAGELAPLFRDACEFLATATLAPSLPGRATAVRVTSHTPCSLRHGQGLADPPRALLRAAGFQVCDAPDDGTCCGSAGTYNLLQPAMADWLGRRKARAVQSVPGHCVATANLGCQLQMRVHTDLPVFHVLQLLDWSQGGPLPGAIPGWPQSSTHQMVDMNQPPGKAYGPP